jgi:hypothetical protein
VTHRQCRHTWVQTLIRTQDSVVQTLSTDCSCTPCRCCCRGGHGAPIGGDDEGAHGCAVGGELSGVSGLTKPKLSSTGVEKRLRNGSETARGTAEYRPRSRPALLLEVIDHRGESHCRRTRHRGGRALPVAWCPHGRFPQRSILKTRSL